MAAASLSPGSPPGSSPSSKTLTLTPSSSTTAPSKPSTPPFPLPTPSSTTATTSPSPNPSPQTPPNPNPNPSSTEIPTQNPNRPRTPPKTLTPTSSTRRSRAPPSTATPPPSPKRPARSSIPSRSLFRLSNTLALLGVAHLGLGAYVAYSASPPAEVTVQGLAAFAFPFTAAFLVRRGLVPIIFFRKMEELGRLQILTLALQVSKSLNVLVVRIGVVSVYCVLGISAAL
ncbi:uncharacterized protein M6B38_302595 [Iris pallida]|uniref:Uncharacterized protein n=1 Tax=Iris pallida TaxID=29817 RepID=A0AAX6HMC1_IRIPA|nr:uncharacterized protein M6B38_302595 [Iris pallida]